MGGEKKDRHERRGEENEAEVADVGKHPGGGVGGLVWEEREGKSGEGRGKKGYKRQRRLEGACMRKLFSFRSRCLVLAGSSGGIRKIYRSVAEGLYSSLYFLLVLSMS